MVSTDIRQLRYFIATAEHLNFTAAARYLYITQQALSQQILELESELGVILFNRSRYSISLTAAGEALLGESKAIVARTEEAILLTRQVASKITGKLKIGYLGFAEKNFLPGLMCKFREKYPDIDLSCHQLSNGAIDQALAHDDIDLGFIQLWDNAKVPGISWKRVYTDKLCLVLPPKHSWANKTNITETELSKETFIFHPNNAPRAYINLMRVCSNRGFRPRVKPVSDIQTVLMMVEAGFGISLLPRYIPLGYGSSTLKIINVDDEDATVYISIAWNDTNTNPSIGLFLTELESLPDFKGFTNSINVSKPSIE